MKNINKLRLLMFLGATLVIAVSCAGNKGNKNTDESGMRREVLSGQDGIEKDGQIPDSTLNANYVMRLENTSLTLYEIDGSEEIAITTINIDPSYYPYEDIEELNRGIVAYSKEEGFARMENYTN